MGKRTRKEWILRCGILMVGLTIAHFGLTLYLLANLGSDPFNVLVQGLSKTLLGLTGWAIFRHGNIHMALCFIILLVILVVDRRYIRVGTVLCMLFGGPIIDGFTFLLGPLFANPLPLWVSLLVELLSCVIVAFGMTVVIRSDAGTGPNDLVSVVPAEKLHIPFAAVRIVTDVVIVGAGWLLGGSVGIGTLICAFLIGPVGGFFLPRSEKLVNFLLEKALHN